MPIALARAIAVVILHGWWLIAPAQNVTLDLPAEVAAGQEFKVKFTTDGSKQDYLYYTDPGAEPNDYKYGFHRISKGSPAKFAALVTPGTYAIRYIKNGKPVAVIKEITFVVTDVTASVTAPDSVEAGTEFKIRVAGPLNPRDYIALTDPDADDTDYKYGYVYTRKINEAGDLKMMAPITPGEYGLRYLLDGKPKDRKLGATTFVVTDVRASVAPPTAAVEAGAEFKVSWEGPNTQGDYIALTDIDADPHTYKHGYTNTNRGNPAKLTAPTTPGEYLVRYEMVGQTGQDKKRSLAQAKVRVGSVSASLDAPAEVPAGAAFEVGFEKPEGSRGYIAIGEVDAEDIDYRYGYKNAYDKPVDLTAPDTAGDYAIRYIQQGNPDVILATVPLKVTPISAALIVPDSVVARSEFEVSWTGPDNARDYIGVRSDEIWASYAYTRRGNPVTLKAPDKPGEYPVIYMMNKRELAREITTVTPGAQYGSLRVVSSQKTKLQADSGVLVILDASGSMWQKLNDRFRIEIAREALVKLVSDTIPADTPFAFRAFGQKEPRSCRTDLEIPLGPLNPDAAVKTINAIEPQELSKTPIATSLAKVGEDLGAINGERVIILVTDGEETCDGDPEAEIRKLTASGIDVRVNIVGFAIDEFALRKTFERWAQLGNGAYLDAQNADELSGAVSQAVDAPFEVLDSAGALVASGTANGNPVSLPVGSYRVRLRGDSRNGSAAEVKLDQTTLVNFD